MTDDQRWQGFVDFIDEPLVVGWAFDTRNPNLPLLVQIAAASGRKAIVRADIFRQDLKDHNIGDGRHGFVADLQDFSALDGPIAITILSSDCVLANDIEFDSLSLRRAVPPIPNSFFDVMSLLATEIRTTTE